MNISKKKCVLVFSGFNPRSVIAFLRTMESMGVDYAIIAKSEQDDIFLTEYKGKVLAIRDSTALILEDLLLSIKKVKEKHIADEYIIAPTTEALNRFILENREYFEGLGCTIPLVKKELYELISDKYSFGKVCSENEIIVPKEIELNEGNIFPIVAKPKKYFSTTKKEGLYPVIIRNSTDCEMFYEEYNVEDFYYQEYIEGRSLYLLYYFHRNGEVYKFSQENLIQQPDGKSMIAAISSDFHNSDESCKYERMFKMLNYHGFVMVEIKQSKNKNYMIEANPRFWGPSQLFVDAGMNFFEAFLYDYGLIELLPKFKQSNGITRYFWFGGLIDTVKNDLNLSFYNISENEFLDLLPKWIESDIYRRDDTIEIFKKEFING
jgi:hypothetical protein